MTGWIRASLIGVMAAGLLLALPAGTALAQSKEQAIKDRQALMKDLSKNIKIVVGFAKKEKGTAEEAAAAARKIASLAPDIPENFIAGTAKGEGDWETRAKPDIWEERDKFEAAARELEEKAEDFVEVAMSGDDAAIAAAAKEIGNGCGGCHKPFRAPKEKK